MVRRRTGLGWPVAAEEGKQLELEAILVARDVGTSKVVVLVGEVANDGTLDIIGKGMVPTTGVKKGLVNNIE